MQSLRVERADTAFTRAYAARQVIDVCIAHGEGNYVADDETLARLEGDGRVAFRYCDRGAGATEASNPNGSAHDIAGIYSDMFNVLGLMPHPEKSDRRARRRHGWARPLRQPRAGAVRLRRVVLGDGAGAGTLAACPGWPTWGTDVTHTVPQRPWLRAGPRAALLGALALVLGSAPAAAAEAGRASEALFLGQIIVLILLGARWAKCCSAPDSPPSWVRCCRA